MHGIRIRSFAAPTTGTAEIQIPLYLLTLWTGLVAEGDDGWSEEIAYARKADDDGVGRRPHQRTSRQTLLVDKPHTTFSFVLEQHLLECQLGGMEVAKHLLDHLLKVSAMLNVDLQVMALRQPDHAGFEGHMYLAETETHEWFGYTEGHRASSLVSTPRDASAMLQRYGKLRAQALDARATVDLLRGMREAL